MSSSILIISSLAEPCTDYVVDELKSLGGSVVRINYEEAVSDTSWCMTVDNRKEAGFFVSSALDNLAKSSHPDSIWMRRWGYPALPISFDEQAKAFAFNEISSLISGLPEFLSGKWVNHPYRERISSNKLLQLRLAKKIGWRIPKTLVTNDEIAVLKFKRETQRVVFKPLSAVQSPFRRFNSVAHKRMHGRWPSMDFGVEVDESLVFTQELTDEKMHVLGSLKWSPAIFQERVDKLADVRVTVVGQQIFSCRIDSQIRSETATDFRYMNVIGALPHESIELGSGMQEEILNYMSELGLVFGCLDFIEVENGEYVFLEVNPSGQWLWIEQLTGAPISRALALELMG